MIYSFYKYHDIKEFDNRSFESKYFLASFSNDLDKFSSLPSKKKYEREKKQTDTIQRHNYIVICQKHILIIL